MTVDQITYLVFGTLLLPAIGFDLGLLSKRSAKVTIRKAFFQTLFWVSLAFLFFLFLWIYESKSVALEYISAHMMEWSLSVDNIFVFILIFSFFRIQSDHGRHTHFAFNIYHEFYEHYPEKAGKR